MNFRANFSRALAVACFCVLTLATTTILAQDNKSQLRTVHGTVVDKSDAPAPSSVVYLLNSKTQAVKTYIADDSGSYRFSGLDPNSDYELHAEKGNMASPNRTISNFDSRRDMDITLKLSRAKGGS